MTEKVKCNCGNDKFYVSTNPNRGVFVELTCTECNETKPYGYG